MKIKFKVALAFGILTSFLVEGQSPVGVPNESEEVDIMTVDCTGASTHPGYLWPPNHKMREVRIMGITGSGNVVVTATSVSVHDEGRGSGNTYPDYAIGGPGEPVWLRAERSGGHDRTYTVSFVATDDGSTCTGEVDVVVPRNKGKPKKGKPKRGKPNKWKPNKWKRNKGKPKKGKPKKGKRKKLRGYGK